MPRKKPVPFQQIKGNARRHRPLHDQGVHLFIDDENLFWGLTDETFVDRHSRIDLGLLSYAAARSPSGEQRNLRSINLAGLVPETDYVWEVARTERADLSRGTLGTRNRDLDDTLSLYATVLSVLYQRAEPSTIVILVGDARYRPLLAKVLERGWRIELVHLGREAPDLLKPVVHEIREIPVSPIILRARQEPAPARV